MLYLGPCWSGQSAVPTKGTTISRPRQLPRAMSRPMIQSQPEFVLISLAHDTTKGHIDAVDEQLPPLAMLVFKGYAAVGSIQT